MKIEGYEYIAHKIINRPWGVECRFAVKKPDGDDINDIVIIKDEKVTEKELVELITSRLQMIDIPIEESIPEPVMYTENQVEELLIEKGYILKGESISSLKSKTEIVEISILESTSIKEIK